MDNPAVLIDQSGGILTVTINRPDRLNALTPAAAGEVTAILEQARADDAIRVVILTGAGRAFCSGADLAEQRPAGESDLPPRAERLDELQWFGRLALALAGIDKPVIGAINGVAAGAGFALALGCDVRIASNDARFSSIFVKRGLSPDTGTTFYLPRLIGLARAYEAVYTGRMIGAAEAERIGLVNQVVAPEEILVTAQRLAGELAAGPPIALQLTRRAIQQSLSNDLLAQLKLEGRSVGFCASTEDFKEGVRSFLEKRPPRFTGR